MWFHIAIVCGGRNYLVLRNAKIIVRVRNAHPQRTVL